MACYKDGARDRGRGLHEISKGDSEDAPKSSEESKRAGKAGRTKKADLDNQKVGIVAVAGGYQLVS